MFLMIPIAPAIAILAALSLVNAACYYPNGTDTNQALGTDAYAQCGDSQSRSHSMCCRTKSPSDNDICRSDGLCTNGNLLWRESCTDPLWESEGCVKLCLSGTGDIFGNGELYDMSTTHVQIKTCDNGSLCCGSEESEMAKTCCQKGQGLWLVNGQVVSTNPSSTQSSTTSETSSPPTSTSKSDSSPKSKSNTGTIVGAVVGGVGGLALVAGAILFFLRRRKRAAPIQEQKIPLAENDFKGQEHTSQSKPDTIQYMHQAPAEELGNGRELVEMGVTSPVKREPNELPA